MSEISLEEYLKRQREIEEVTLPSGFKVKIRKRLSPLRCLKILGKAGLSWDEMGPGLSIDKYNAFCEIGFSELLVEPKVPQDIKAEDFEDKDFAELHKILVRNFQGDIEKDVKGLEPKELDNKDFTTPSE